MECKICGSKKFYAHQVVHVDVICDEDGDFIRNAYEDSMEEAVYHSEHPYGPFTCTRCGATYEELNDNAPVSDITALFAPVKGRPGKVARIESFHIEGDGDEVHVSPLQTEQFVPGCWAPIDTEDILVAVRDHRIVRSWIAVHDTKLPMVDEWVLNPSLRNTPAAKPRIEVPSNLAEVEARFGFCNCDGQAYILLDTPKLAHDRGFFPESLEMRGAFAVPVKEHDAIPSGDPVLLVWSSEAAFNAGDRPLVVKLDCKEALPWS